MLIIKKNNMDFEKQENKITPTDELKYAQEGLDTGDWGEVENCLGELAKKVLETSPSSDEREQLKNALEVLKTNINATEVPEEYKDRIARALENAETSL